MTLPADLLITAEEVERAIELKDAGRSVRDIAWMLRLSPSIVQRAVNGEIAPAYSVPRRCPQCRALVTRPCVACKMRATLAKPREPAAC